MDRDYNAEFAECLKKNLSRLPHCLRPITWNDQGSKPSFLGEKPATRYDIFHFDPAAIEERQRI